MLMNKWFKYVLIVTFIIEGSAQVEQPLINVLFIMVDDLRPELNIYGQSHIKSPNIDALASEGVTFNRAYCNVPVCGASRASMLSGLRPTESRFLRYNASIKKQDLRPKILLNTLMREGIRPLVIIKSRI